MKLLRIILLSMVLLSCSDDSEMYLEDAEELIRELENELDSINRVYEGCPELFDSLLQLPMEIQGNVGNTLQIFYNAMVTTPYSYHTRITCDIGKQMERYYEVTPNIPGTYSFKVELLAPNYSIIDSKTISLVIKEAVQQPISEHYFWTIGDSLTNNPTWTNEMMRMLTGDGGYPSGNNFGNIFNHRIGYSGKQWNWYVTNEDSPFVYDGKLNFERYRIDNNLEVPNSMFILLTWNGMGLFRNQLAWDLWDNDVYQFIDSVKSAFPNCEIVLMSPNFPSMNGGLGDDYGANGEYYSDYFLGIINVKKQAQIYERISHEVGFEFVEHIETALQFDNKYNMPANLDDANSRNSESQVLTGYNGVHPSKEGYYQIADAAYRHFINKYCQ